MVSSVSDRWGRGGAAGWSAAQASGGRGRVGEEPGRRSGSGPKIRHRTGSEDRPAAGRPRFFPASLADSQGSRTAERRAWREGVYTVIEAMPPPLPQGQTSVERMCRLARVSRAGYYRHWAASAPRQEETAIRDAVQRVALANRRYGYRRIAKELHRDGLVVNHKRVLRLMRRDNLLCLRKRPFVPITTDSRHGWRGGPQPARRLGVSGVAQLWVAGITHLRLLAGSALPSLVVHTLSPRPRRFGS